MQIGSYGSSLTGNLELFIELMDESLMQSAIPQAWFLDKHILMPSARSQVKKAKVEANATSCTEAEQGYAARRLLGAAITKAKEYDIALDDPKFARRIAQRVSETDRASLITVAKKFTSGLQAVSKHYGMDFTSLLPEFDKGTYDAEILNTRMPELKGPYWSFFKKASEQYHSTVAEKEAKQAELELEQITTGEAALDEDTALDANTKVSLQLCWQRLTNTFLLALKGYWWKQRQHITQVVEKGKEMWVDREDRLRGDATDESCGADQYQLTKKGTDPLSMILTNHKFMQLVLARPCCLWLDLGIADYDAEALEQALRIFGVNGLVLLLQTGTQEENGKMLEKEQTIMRSLSLAKCARIWLQVEAEAGGVGVQEANNKKQTGSLCIFAENTEALSNPLANRVSRS